MGYNLRDRDSGSLCWVSVFQGRCRTLIQESALTARWAAKHVPQVSYTRFPCQAHHHMSGGLIKYMKTLVVVVHTAVWFSPWILINHLFSFVHRRPWDLQQLCWRLLSVSFFPCFIILSSHIICCIVKWILRYYFRPLTFNIKATTGSFSYSN